MSMSSNQALTVEQIIIDTIHLGRTQTIRALKRAGYHDMNLAKLKARCDAMRRDGVALSTAVSRPWTAVEDAILLANPNPHAAHAALVMAGFDRTAKAVAQRKRDKEKA